MLEKKEVKVYEENCWIALIKVQNMNEVKKEVRVAKSIQQEIMILKIEYTTATEIIKGEKDMTTHEETVAIEIMDIKVMIKKIILKA